MKYTFLAPFAAVVLGLPVLSAQQEQKPQPEKAQAQQEHKQQPDKVQLPKSQVPTLNRPTKPTDQAPLFNFDDYFNGKWTFTWDVPEGPLGPAGTLTGTTVYKPIVDGKFYEATTDATGPGGALKMKETIGYLRDNHSLFRSLTDSRGYSFLQMGTVGGDLGGYFTIYYESTPFEYKGKSLRMKSSMRLLSPINYKVATTISVDGGPFTNYGNPWWRKEVPGLSSR